MMDPLIAAMINRSVLPMTPGVNYGMNTLGSMNPLMRKPINPNPIRHYSPVGNYMGQMGLMQLGMNNYQ